MTNDHNFISNSIGHKNYDSALGQTKNVEREAVLSTQINSLIDSLRSDFIEKNELGDDKKSLGGGDGAGAGAGAAPGADVSAAQEAGLIPHADRSKGADGSDVPGDRSREHADRDIQDARSKGADGGDLQGDRSRGHDDNNYNEEFVIKSSLERNADNSSEHSQGKIDGEMETLLQILVALFGSDLPSDKDKNRIMSFLHELKDIINGSGKSDLQSNFDQILTDGLRMLENDRNVSGNDLGLLASLVNSDDERATMRTA